MLMAGVGEVAADPERAMPSEYRKTRTSGLYVRHSRACPSFADEQRRCRCEPSYRTHRRIDGTMRWSPVFKDRASAMSWDGHEAKAERAVRAIRREGPTFGEVAGEWWALVEAAPTPAAAGAARSYRTRRSPTTGESRTAPLQRANAGSRARWSWSSGVAGVRSRRSTTPTGSRPSTSLCAKASRIRGSRRIWR